VGNEASISSRSQTIGRDPTLKPASGSGNSPVRPATAPTNLQKIPETDISVYFEGYRDLPLLLVVTNDTTDHSTYEHLRDDLLRSVRWAAYGKANGDRLGSGEAKAALLQVVGATQPKVLLASGSACETLVEALEDRPLLAPIVILIQPDPSVVRDSALQAFQGHLLLIASMNTLQEEPWSSLSFPLAASVTRSGIANSGSHPAQENPSSVNAVIATNLRKLRSSDALS